MNNAVVLPLLIPLLAGVVLVFFSNVRAQRTISALAALLNVAACAYLVQQVRTDGIQTLYMGGWLPPFGIVFVADMLGALLALTSAVVMGACLFYAFRTIGEGRERHHFYALAQFLTVGVIGSFLTGDIFNLFVCFEVMLISSYALIVLGGEKRQLRESIKYILINIVSSILFVASMAYLYAALGTLNMAQLAVRVAETGQGGGLNVVAALLLVVFSLKAGLFLFFWLPGSYGAPPSVVAAMFGGLLTKVGVYAIVRTFTLIFAYDPGFTQPLIEWMSIGAMTLGALGAVAYRDVPRILIYNIVVAVGLIGFGLSAATEAALDGVVFYLLHDMVAKALVFLLGGWLMTLAGTDRSGRMGGLIEKAPALGWMFFATGMAIAGVPPLSGFVGKLLIVQGGLEGGRYIGVAVALATSLLVLLSLTRLFMSAFWGEPKSGEPASVVPSGLLAPCASLLAIVALLGVGAEWVNAYVSLAGEVLARPELYIEAVLKE
ncbi:Na+/H+ antiporter subunit D [Paenibacillus antri]|uniref:Na+/H+ antiporter subunit D n=1 Tax=Paenibacillus antri TaxID=2582848 RepID=A0A5R9GCT1_9BACL|nr:Na+/H+ antiporter subunit D [Paenibacillus antri]TLS53551.1 Na+/H+ antiporter subunit D [Paenibacillus antri]